MRQRRVLGFVLGCAAHAVAAGAPNDAEQWRSSDDAADWSTDHHCSTSSKDHVQRDLGASIRKSEITTSQGQIVVGVGRRIEWLDPSSARALHREVPIDLSTLVWQRFIHRGQYILAEGLANQYTTRGLALLQCDGRVLWTQTHNYGPRMWRGIYLGADGTAAFDTPTGGRVVKPTGVVIDTGSSVPIASPTYGVVPVRHFGLYPNELPPQPYQWLHFDRLIHGDAAPELTDVDTRPWLRSSGNRLSIVKVLREPPQRPYEQWSDGLAISGLPRASLTIPLHCGEVYVAPTASTDHFLVGCAVDDKHYRQMVINVPKRQLKIIRVAGDDGPEPCEVGHMTLNSRGEPYAINWHGCSATLKRADANGHWTTVRRFETRVPFTISAVCGHLVLRPSPYETSNENGGCSCGDPEVGKYNSWVKAYSQREDGSWLGLPYDVPEPSESCSPDGYRIAGPFERDKHVGVSIVSLDHYSESTVDYEQGPSGAGLGSILPLVWLQ